MTGSHDHILSYRIGKGDRTKLSVEICELILLICIRLCVECILIGYIFLLLYVVECNKIFYIF